MWSGRKIVTYRLGNKRPRLTVKIDGSPILVRADLSMDGLDKIPEAVSFYYSGDPRREVHLLQEGNQLLGTLVCWAYPVCLFPLFAWWLIRETRSKSQVGQADPYFAKSVIDEI